MTVENLDIVAQVENEFSKKLEQLETELRKLPDTVSIDADVNITEAKRQLKELDREIEKIDDDFSVDARVDREHIGEDVESDFSSDIDETVGISDDFDISRASIDVDSAVIRTNTPSKSGDDDEIAEQLQANSEAIEALTDVLDTADTTAMRSPDSRTEVIHRHFKAGSRSGSKTADGDADDGAVGDGGDDDSRFFSAEQLQQLSDQFGEQFDVERLIERRGDISSERELLDLDISEEVDQTELIRSVERGDIDLDSDSLISDLRAEGLLELEDDKGTLQRFKEEIDNINPKMGSFFKILATFLPVIFTFIAALPAAITGVVALGVAAVSAAAALAGIGGLGLLGIGLEDGQFSMEPLQEEFEELKTAFIEAFGPLANTFAPVVRDFLDDIQRLFDAIAARGRSIALLKDEFANLGDTLVRVVPPIIAGIAQLGNAAAPIINDLIDYLLSVDAAQIVGNIIADLLPLLRRIGAAIVQILPVLYDLSRGFLIVVTGVLQLLAVIFQLINYFDPLAEVLGLLLGVLGVLVTIGALKGVIAGIGGLLTILSAKFIAVAAAIVVLVTAVGKLLELLTGGAFKLTMPDIFPDSPSRDNLRNLGASRAGTNVGRGGTTVNNFRVNADSREQANRTTQSLRYQNAYTSGNKADSEFN